MTNSTFDAFWSVWLPIRSGLSDDKRKAEEKYWKARKDTPHEVMVAGAERYLAHCEAKGIEKQFRKMAKTWLFNRCWESELDTTPAGRLADSNTPRPCPQYLRRRDEDRRETPEQRRRKQLRLDAHEVLRKRGMEPLLVPKEEIERVMRELEANHHREARPA